MTMATIDILSKLSNRSNNPDNNVELLKKIILTAHIGQLRINSQLPDKECSLADYLFDDQSLIIDFKLLTESTRTNFINWLLAPHHNDKERVFLHRQGTNISRGYLAEVKLNWWGKFKSWLFNEHFDHWEFDEISSLKEHQLTGVTIRQNKKGLILNFSQFGLRRLFLSQNNGKYSDPDQVGSTPDGNVKRLVLNDVLVDRIIKKFENGIEVNQLKELCETYHPMSVEVLDRQKRYQHMSEYRVREFFNPPRPWYLRMIDWFVEFFRHVFEGRPLPIPGREQVFSDTKNPRNLIGNPSYNIGNYKTLNQSVMAFFRFIFNGRPLPVANRGKGYEHALKNQIEQNSIDSDSENKKDSNLSDIEKKLNASIKGKVKRKGKAQSKLHQFCESPEHSQVSIAYRQERKDFVVTELRPADNPMLVFCGGGPKIYAHAGVMKAFNDTGIKPLRFAGSSAGAIMALLCYMGYNSDEIADLLEPIKKEHLVSIQMNKQGFSESHRLEALLDYIISNKLYEIVNKYGLPYPEGPITFAFLEELRQKFPDCGIGEELVVTATETENGRTSYFSFHASPDISVSKAVCASASLPVIFRPKELSDGKRYTDGGVSANFPMEAFLDSSVFDKSHTLLCSNSGVRPEVIGVQFDYGHEEALITKLTRTVYRENWFLNWIYGLLTGVKDPASNWVDDRFKLKDNPMQSMVVKADTDSYLSPTIREKIESSESGYITAAHYLDSRYYYEIKDKTFKNDELIQESFESLEALLIHCCSRGHYFWFQNIQKMINDTAAGDEIFQLQNKEYLLSRSRELEGIYFSGESLIHKERPVKKRFDAYFNHSGPVNNDKKNKVGIFNAVVPLMMSLNVEWFQKNNAEKIINKLRDTVSIDDPLQCLQVLDGAEELNEAHHFLIAMMKIVLGNLKNDNISNEYIKSSIESLQFLFEHASIFNNEIYLQKWKEADVDWDELYHSLMTKEFKIFVKDAERIVKNNWYNIETWNELKWESISVTCKPEAEEETESSPKAGTSMSA